MHVTMYLVYAQYQLFILECTLITIEIKLTGLHQLINITMVSSY